MSQPLTDAITALTTYANSVTGASDTTLSDAVATLASGYGGGGLQLVDTINVTTTTRNISIDMTPYLSYDIIFVKAGCQLSANSWIYLQYNASSPTTSGHAWQGDNTSFNTVLYCITKKLNGTQRTVLIYTNYNNTIESNANVELSNIFINAYEVSTNILAGSKFYIYGMNYSDM